MNRDPLDQDVEKGVVEDIYAGHGFAERADHFADREFHPCRAGDSAAYGLFAVDMCDDSTLSQDAQGHWKITGGPTEGALKVLAAKAHLPKVAHQISGKIPFDSLYKYMAIACERNGQSQVMLTGAPDVLLKLCQFQQTLEGAQPLDRAYWESAITQYASEGLRMVAAAWKPVDQPVTALDHPELNQGMVLIGIALFVIVEIEKVLTRGWRKA